MEKEEKKKRELQLLSTSISAIERSFPFLFPFLFSIIDFFFLIFVHAMV